MQSTLAQLRELQTERRGREAETLELAAELRKFNEAHGLVWQLSDADNPAEPVIEVDGFEFSLNEIDDHIEVQTRLAEARDYALDNQ